MKDFELYQQLQGLSEAWQVKNVTLKREDQEVAGRGGLHREGLGPLALN